MKNNLRSLLSHPIVPWVLPLFWLVPPFASLWLTGSWQSAGVVGDAFGVANSLFSGIALLGIVANMKSARMEALEREERYNSEQTALREQTIQLALATRLDSTRALIATHRSVLLELNPAIRSVPSSPTLLYQLRTSIRRDAAAKIIPEHTATEIIENLDELALLQAEVATIRTHLEKIYASTPINAGKYNGKDVN